MVPAPPAWAPLPPPAESVPVKVSVSDVRLMEIRPPPPPPPVLLAPALPPFAWMVPAPPKVPTVR